MSHLLQNYIANDINPMIRQWMSAMTAQQLQLIVPTITITDQQMARYIVHTAMETQSTTGDSSAATPRVPSVAPTSPCNSQSSDGSFMSAEDAVQKGSAQVRICNRHCIIS